MFHKVPSWGAFDRREFKVQEVSQEISVD